ncbi:MAG: TonB-dependent receptor [Robiginitomaculum sp.]|nr:MAG: TonB-dependent receptor [Robiginitomaculum sp.]
MARILNTSKKRTASMRNLLLGTALTASLAVISAPAYAQQAGAVNGRIYAEDGSALAGVVVEARSPVLPQARTTTSGANGRYQLPLLPPGEYIFTYRNPDGTVVKREASVLLQQKIRLDVSFGEREDAIIVTGTKSFIDTGRANLKNTLNTAMIEGVPIGQEYRDLQKLIPGVQYSEDNVRGPSAGGSGQDNNYQFDGVDVTLPLFGTLSAEPSTHDIAQVSIIRGGTTARGFNRSGGFSINTISKRGTNEFHGEASYKVQDSGLTSGRKSASVTQFQEDQKWITASLGGPIVRDKLFAYGSYYRPTVTRQNVSNALGTVPDFKSTRNEYFGKLTFAPTSNILLDASYRTSDRSAKNRGVGQFAAPSTSQGDDASQDIIIVEGSWIIDDKSSFSFKFTDFQNNTASRPDNLFNLDINLGDALNINALDQQGLFLVPQPLTGETAFNAFIQPLIDQYGFIGAGGVPTGGGTIGGASTINSQDFSRTSFEMAFDRTFEMGSTSHDLHIGYQYQSIGEDLARLSNGYGFISVPGGRITASDGITPVFFQARVSALSIDGLANANGPVPNSIKSNARLQSFEINDTIEKGNLTFNVGVLISQDELFGQGLRKKSGTISGFEVAAGNRYKMKKIKWNDMIQPRLGVNWQKSPITSLYANFARSNPAASSLARAASWDRNIRRNVDVSFDANGNFIEIDPVRSSSGKVFQDGIKPRKIDEYLIGWNHDVSDELVVRVHTRFRHAKHFWEDTNNTARLFPDAPAEIAALGLYVPNLNDIRAEIGGSSYVIAQLDNASTDYYEAGFEAEYNSDNWSVTASYVYSRFTGNFDQDNTTTTNDANSFIGSSFIADGIGRQLWNFRQGRLKGDRPHQFKVYGYYKLPWNAQAGAFVSYQSGQPWEAWDVEFYRAFTRSRSDTSRFAEPAGSRRTSEHLQVDLNYTQNIAVMSKYNIQLRADLFNALNSQTGYNIQNKVNSAGFGTPRSFFRPRRLQLSVKASF